MAANTRRQIIDAFLTLLEDRPVNRISVKDIVTACGINRNTFYYYFSDMPELVEEIVKADAEEILKSQASLNSLEDCVDVATRRCKENQRAIWNIYHSGNREIYERYLLEICEHVVRVYIHNTLGERRLDPSDLAAIIQCYKCEVFGFVTDWLNNNMSDVVTAQFLRVCALRRGVIDQMIDRALSDA